MKRYLTLSLRELFLLVALVAMGCGWWVHAQQWHGERIRLQTDLLMQADYVRQFVSVLNSLGCEIPPDSDPRCVIGGPYTRIFVPEKVTQQTGCVSFTLSGPRSELQRTIDGEFGERFRNKQ